MSIITKGLIGIQDMSLGTGTFTRTTSTGGTNTLSQVDFVRQVPTGAQTITGFPLSIIIGGATVFSLQNDKDGNANFAIQSRHEFKSQNGSDCNVRSGAATGIGAGLEDLLLISDAAIAMLSPLIQVRPGAPSGSDLSWVGGIGNPILFTLPNDTAVAWPNSGIRFNATIAGINGVNKNLLLRNTLSTSAIIVGNAGTNATIFQLTESSGGAILALSNPTNSPVTIDASNTDLARITFRGTTAGCIFYSNSGAGTSGIFRFRNNPTDDVDTLRIDAATGNITTYGKIATVSNGVPSELATVDLTAQTAAIAATTLYTPTATGMFRISAYLKITTAGTSPVLGPLTITYTDGTDSVAQSVIMAQQTQAGSMSVTGNNGNTTTSVLTGSLVVYAKTGVAIQYAVALTGTVGAAQYEVHLKCEAL